MDKQVKITRVDSDFVGTNEYLSSVASMTVSLNNGDDYQLRVVPDSNGNVFVWIDHRLYKDGKWVKLVEILNGKQRRI